MELTYTAFMLLTRILIPILLLFGAITLIDIYIDNMKARRFLALIVALIAVIYFFINITMG